MALDNSTADALATAITTALGVTDTVTLNKYKQIYEIVYAHLKADIAIIIGTNAIVTAGSASTQQGPPAPVTINPA